MSFYINRINFENLNWIYHFYFCVTLKSYTKKQLFPLFQLAINPIFQNIFKILKINSDTANILKSCLSNVINYTVTCVRIFIYFRGNFIWKNDASIFKCILKYKLSAFWHIPELNFIRKCIKLTGILYKRNFDKE